MRLEVANRGHGERASASRTGGEERGRALHNVTQHPTEYQLKQGHNVLNDLTATGEDGLHEQRAQCSFLFPSIGHQLEVTAYP
jgi:hypothetical protein